MPTITRPGWVPKYRHHKSSGQAARAPMPIPGSSGSAAPATVGELILAFWQHAQPIYPKQTLSSARAAFGPLRSLFGHTAVKEFSPLGLKAVQKHLADLTVGGGDTPSVARGAPPDDIIGASAAASASFSCEEVPCCTRLSRC